MSTLRLAVLGSPITHSQSPAIHTAAYAALGLDWEYGRFELDADGLAAFLAARGQEWRGFSLTMPLKFQALALADEVDATARITGAVNTLLFSGAGATRRLHGFNTDVTGLVNSLADNGITSARSVLIVGGGATAGSAIMAAAELGAGAVVVAVRRPDAADGLHELARAAGVALRIVALADAVAAASEIDLVISTLPGGADAGLRFDAELMLRTPLYDVAYSPWPSPLGAAWQRAGGRVISGIGMLLHQALVQVRIFVAGDPFAELPNEKATFAAMSAAVQAGSATHSDAVER
ncbi:shikimate dehydrogenase [Microterricola gilva]|uniref:Shikimate dehydrogenase n=1 Tax=Microterricola gilva TaxID=393267 RepID=A0A4V2GAN8_9MICO|nr:shikimate dehydrogenase [Microterricola gilva]RZU65016.1 shikimate dehydrogenase [Microterricola gilva]